jgi:RND family efflux transporter MFP subunit
VLSSSGSPAGSQAALIAPSPVTSADLQPLWNVLDAAESVQAAAPAWLDLLCLRLPRVSAGVLVFGEPDVGPFMPLANWPQGQSPSPLLAEAANGAFEAKAPALIESDTHVAVALPMIVAGKLYGLVAIELLSRSETGGALDAMRWAFGRLEALIRAEAARERDAALDRVTTALNLLAGTLAEQSFSGAAHALATDLALHLHCDRVSVGFVRKGSAEVVAVSHSAQFGDRMNLIRAIGLAMDESLDQNCAVIFPSVGSEVLVMRDHASLARQHGCGAILTVPFTIEGEGAEPVRGAFTFERATQKPFDTPALELCQGAVALASRVLETKRLNERSIAVRMKEAVRDHYMQVIGPKHFGRKLTAIFIASATFFFAIATGRYDVNANATLEGAIRRVVVAPYDGYIESAQNRAGDKVKAGDVLAAMDQRDLSLEQLRVAGQVEQHAKQAQEASAEHDRAQSAIASAQAQQAQAQLDLLADQIQRAAIVAPFNGIVVSGDLSQQLGGAVKRGQVLFEVSPLNAYRITLEVDESEIDAIKLGQKGRLVLVALPGKEWPMTVSRITPVTVSHEGHSYFKVEATLDKLDAGLRPGMEGVAKIDTGSRHLFWIWTHRFFDWLRVWAWSWL